VTKAGSGPDRAWWRRWQPLTIAPLLRMLTIRYSVPADSPLRTTCGQCAVSLDARSAAAGLFGRCECGIRLGPPPLLLEVVVVACAAALAFSPGLSGWERLAYGWWAACGIVLAFTDLAVHRLPRPLAFASVAGLLVLLAPTALRDGHVEALTRAAAAGVLVAALLAVGALLPGTGLGGGDVTAGLSVGAAAGWISWFAAFAALFTAFLLVAACGMILLIAGRARSSTAIALGPALFTGALLVIVLLGGTR
jgi:leader peptidase (prepilin peptidase)/N-methyltransferase